MDHRLITFGPLRPGAEVERLLRASAAEFGAEGYQQHARYLDWLYLANPAGRGLADCLVARQGEGVVGCMHRMVLPLTGPDGAATLAVLHNHFVGEAMRAGPGVLLLRRAVKDVDLAFAPGVKAPLDQVYRRLGFAEHPGFWLVRVLDPVGGALRFARTRAFGDRPLRVRLEALRRRFPDLLVTATPGDADVERLCVTMRADDGEHARVDWTPALVRWRYFDPRGPRHLLVTPRSGGAMAVIAPGVRRGIGSARLMELTDPADARFLARVEKVMRGAGAAIGLCFATDPSMADRLARAGWRRRDGGTFSFTSAGATPLLTAAASDVGFEALNTEID